ncbi:C-terminal binding protein [Frankia sp. CNm7]|nr:C-terminal binding protein [Frankia nepalensis]
MRPVLRPRRRAGRPGAAGGRGAGRGAAAAGPSVVGLLVGPETAVCEEDLAALPDLRIVAVTSTGVDHVPLAAARWRGIWVTSSAGYCTEEVADHTLALAVGLLRAVTALDRRVRAGHWDVGALRPRRVAGTRWGLVGFGRIARAVAARAHALAMVTASWDPSVPDGLFAGAGTRRAADLAGLLAGSDVVSVHLPLTAATRGLLGVAELATMPAGSYLGYVARGELVDVAALDAALRSGRLAGAALDVLPVEPPPPGDPALSLPRTVLTPHAAWYSERALALAYEWAAATIADVLAGRRPERVVVEPAATAAGQLPGMT